MTCASDSWWGLFTHGSLPAFELGVIFILQLPTATRSAARYRTSRRLFADGIRDESAAVSLINQAIKVGMVRFIAAPCFVGPIKRVPSAVSPIIAASVILFDR